LQSSIFEHKDFFSILFVVAMTELFERLSEACVHDENVEARPGSTEGMSKFE
jgi:hypothetical protein